MSTSGTYEDSVRPAFLGPTAGGDADVRMCVEQVDEPI